MDRDLQSELPALCRVCMEVTTKNKSDDIYSSSSDSGQPNLHSMLRAVCGPVFSSDGTRPDICSGTDERPSSHDMPRNVCLRCKQDVMAAYELHLRCIDTNRKLHELIMMKYAQEDSEMKFLKVFLKAPSAEHEVIDEKEERMDSSEEEVYEPFGDDESEEDIKDITLQKSSTKSRQSSRRKKISGLQVAPVICELLEDGEETKVDTSSNGSKAEGNSKESTVPKKRRSRKPTLPATCELCPEVCKSPKILQVHMKKMHKDNIVNCDACQMAFFTNEQFEEHRQFHITGKLYACEFCDKRYKNQSTLSTHMLVHKNKDPLLCTECGKTLINKIAVKYHMANYHAVKAFACERCPLRFFTKAKLNKHMVTHTGEKNHICDICGSRFGMAETLRTHVKRIHEGERNHPCATCGMKFKSAEVLKRHIRTHTGEKPYKCAYCDRAYAQSNDLVKHSKVHVGENPYACDRCDAAFRLMTELRNHYKVHFQPEDPAAGGATEALVKEYINVHNKSLFTSTATLNRRFEQDKQRMEL